MHTIRKIIIFISLLFAAIPSIGLEKSDRFLCLSEAAQGFVLEDNEWKPTRFDVSDKKYTIRPLSDDERATKDEFLLLRFGEDEFPELAYVMTEFGVDRAEAVCTPDKSPTHLYCAAANLSWNYDFVLNTETYEFMWHDTLSFEANGLERLEKAGMWIMVGSCSRI